MAIRPLDDRVVVKPLEAEEQTSGGILLPDSAKEKPQRATVLAVGEGRVNDKGERIALTLKSGDEVLFGKYAGTDIKWNDEEYKILRESEILAIVEKKTVEKK